MTTEAEADTAPERRGGALRKAARLYTGVALLIFNTLIAFVVLNAVVAVYLKSRREATSQPVVLLENHEEHLRKCYPDWDLGEVRAMLKEMARPFELVAYTMFQERPFEGKYVNVHEARFRVGKNQGPWPPDPEMYNIFFFGGSTAFGYLVTDEETIPSRVQEGLERAGVRARVYNFGQGSFYSTQERIQYEQLITAGHVPDMAVFFDGLNDFQRLHDQPRYLDTVQVVYDNVTGLRRDVEVQLPALKRLPLYQLATMNKPAVDWVAQRGPAVAERLAEPVNEPGADVAGHHAFTDADREYFNHPPTVNGMVDLYLANKRMIEQVSTGTGVTPVFVWQPVPSYDFDFRDYFPSGQGLRMFSYYGYPVMKGKHNAGETGANFLWAADLQAGFEGAPVYVDGTHYTAPMSEVIGRSIAQFILQQPGVADLARAGAREAGDNLGEAGNSPGGGE